MQDLWLDRVLTLKARYDGMEGGSDGTISKTLAFHAMCMAFRDYQNTSVHTMESVGLPRIIPMRNMDFNQYCGDNHAQDIV